MLEFPELRPDNCVRPVCARASGWIRTRPRQIATPRRTGIVLPVPRRLFLNRKLLPQRWSALALLTLGTTLSEMRVGGLRREHLLAALLRPPWQGCALVILGAWLSAAAGVYTEFLMKRTDDSMFWQNTQLYM